ncbi:hypothetical protein C8F04DRAFT_1261162 [Mycena alexandri]|uniref:Uncharacterized protein n=1 Tax=Mycena alexandri TaxID=1745969 RepID=A0AAD6SUT8_9AGAR|nr:hypothetical protein C8F04DRAFT_1261162 [Mycena alexandri]
MPAPGGHLDFRTTPAIGRREAITVNAGRGLVLNTTPGGNWIPNFKPRTEIWNAVSGARLPFQSTTPEGLSNALSERLTKLLEGEYKFWRREVGKEKVCVPATLLSITRNLVDAAWTVQGSTVMVAIAEDITEEERKGRIGGIEEETAGPALKEFMHIVRTLHAADDSLITPQQLRQIRGPFLNLYRMQEPVDRASHLAFFMRLLSYLAPFLITSWSSTMNCCSHNTSKIIPDNWYSAGRRTQGEEYINDLGLPCLAYYSHLPDSLCIFISNLQLGGAKHDPRSANLCREIFLVISGGVVEPAMAMIERDLLDNGPLDRSDVAGLESRLGRLRLEIYDHAERHGVYRVLTELKTAYRILQHSLRLLRSLPHRNKRSSAVDDDDHLSASCPGEGDYSDEDTASDATSDEDDTSDAEKNGVQRRSRFRGYIEVAATGKVARQAQLERLVEEAKRAERLGLPVDPLGFAPFGTTLTSPEFAQRFMALADGKDLGQWGRSWGRTPATNQAALDSRKNIGVWNTAQAVERRVLLDAEAEAHGLAPETVHERSRRPAQLSAFIKAVQDPRNITQRILLQAVRWGTCGVCQEIVVGSGIATKHFCVKDPDNPLTLTESSFPSLQRLVYTHDVLNNPYLNALLTGRPDLVSRAVASILGPAELQAALPLDYTNYDPSICTTSVYLPAVLGDEIDLWVTLAVDVVLLEQARCPDNCKPTTATQRNVPWKDTNSAALSAWATPRMTGKIGLPLVIVKCDWGWIGAIKKMSVRGGTQEPFYIHTCEQSENREKSGEKRTNTFNGTRNCGTCKWQEIHSMVDLPAEFSRFFWLSHRVL